MSNKVVLFLLFFVVGVAGYIWYADKKKNDQKANITPLNDLKNSNDIPLTEAQKKQIIDAALNLTEQQREAIRKAAQVTLFQTPTTTSTSTVVPRKSGGTITATELPSTSTPTNTWGIETISPWTNPIDPNGEYIQLDDGTLMPKSWFNFDNLFTGSFYSGIPQIGL